MTESTAHLEQRMLAALTTIRDHWEALLVPSTGALGGASADVVTGTDRRVSLRHEVTLTLNGWARIVIEDRGLHHDLPLGTDTPGMIVLLQRHARWFSGHEAAADALHEWASLADRVRDAATGARTARFTVGRCPETVWADPDTLTRCPGELYVTLRREDTLLPKRIVCAHDPGHAWAPHEWATLGRRVEAAGGLGGETISA